MKKIYPTGTDKLNSLDRVQSWKMTEELYNAIQTSITELQLAVADTNDELDDYKQEIAEQITTIIINANQLTVNEATIVEAAITDLLSDNATIKDLTVETITSTVNATFNRLAADEATIPTLHSTDIDAETVTADAVSSTTVTAETVNVNEFNITNQTVEDLTVTDADITNANVTNATIDGATINDETVTKSTITEADVNELKAAYANLTKFCYEFSNTDNEIYQAVDGYATGADGDYYILLPKFTNGTYFLMAEGPDKEQLWSMEIDNSTRNISFSWSISTDTPFLKKVEIVEDSTDGLQYIQIHAKTFGESTKLYHRADSFDEDMVPSLYSTPQVDGTKDFEFNKKAGIWLPNAVFAGEFHADSITIDDIIFDEVTVAKSIILPTAYDQYGEPLGFTRGTKGQYITNTEDGYGNEGVQWETPADGVYRDDERLITSDAVSEYDGKVQTGTTPEEEPIYEYPVKHLGDETVVHGQITSDTNIVNNEVQMPNLYNGPEANMPATLPNGSIVVFTEVGEESEASANVIYRYRKTVDSSFLEEIRASTTVQDQKPLIYDLATNSFKTTDAIDIDSMVADTITTRELYVSGTAHINNTEEHEVEGNFATLRANNSAALTSGEYSGVLVNNFDGNGNIAAVVIDHNGTARVGHATGTSTTYENLYYSEGVYYTDAELTQVVEPDGVLLSWDSVEIVDNVKHWTNAVFKALNFSSTEAILTRVEANTMNDQGLIKWNSSTEQADTLPLPTESNQSLISNVDTTDPENPVISYSWQDKQPGVYHYETEEEYEAEADNIPEGSLIIIDEQENYLYGDDQ